MKLSYLGKLLKELYLFAKKEKAYWIVPLVLMLLLFSVLVVTGQTVAPFIYTLF
ncbi:MAG: DUF5989 family protein [Vulcanimicrobiota bacterium]